MLNQKGNLSIVLGGIVLLITVSALSYYLGTQNKFLQLTKPQFTPTPVSTQPPVFTSITKSHDEFTAGDSTHTSVYSCDKESCLFRDNKNNVGYLEGYAKLTGYYHKYDTTDFDTKTTCESLIVTGGNENLIEHFKSLIEAKNTINKLDEKGNLMLNIDTSQLTAATKNAILSSNPQSKVELGIIRYTPRNMGASSCTSLVNILSATKLQLSKEE